MSGKTSSAVILMFAAALAAPGASAQQEAPKTFAEFEALHEFKCNAPLQKLAAPEVQEHGGFRYELWGSTVKVQRTGEAKKGPVKLGVLSAIKDAEPETFALLEEFLKAFEKNDVEVIIVGGDTGDDAAVLDRVYSWLAQRTQRPILAVAGNTERSGAHNYAVSKVRKGGAPHLFNGGLIRRLDARGFDVVGLAGYYDQRYAHARGVCIYKPEDVEAVIAAAGEADDPVVLLTHGPPRQSGKRAVDYVPGVGNVGDPELTRAVTEAKIPFGIHGHILEAGANATDLAGKPVPPGRMAKALFLNPGSANPLPWKLNTGKTAYGLAAILTIDGKKARYEILRGAKPKN